METPRGHNALNADQILLGLWVDVFQHSSDTDTVQQPEN